MSQKRRKCKLANSDYADVDLRQFEQTILDVVNETVPNKNPRVFEKYFSTDVLTQSEAVLLGRAFAKIRGKEISIANIVKALEVGFSIELMQRLETLKK